MYPPNSPNVSAPPPPPPPVDWRKDWRQTKNNDQNGKPYGSIASEFSNSNPQNCTSTLINTSVGISKADALKYSIATLLLCTSSIAAGIHTYLAISAILSSVAVPVLFAVIASVSALIVLSSTVYLINSFFSAVSSEKKIDFDKLQRNKSQDIVGGAADLLTPAQPPVTLGAQPSPSASVSPPPPPPQLSHSAAPPPPPPPPPPSAAPIDPLEKLKKRKKGKAGGPVSTSNSSLNTNFSSLAEEAVEKRRKLKRVDANDGAHVQQDSSDENNTEQKRGEDLAERIEMDLKKGREEKESAVQQPGNEPINSQNAVQACKVVSGILLDKINKEYDPPIKSSGATNDRDDDWDTDPDHVNKDPFSIKDLRGPVNRNLLPPKTKVDGGVDTSEISFKEAFSKFSQTG